MVILFDSKELERLCQEERHALRSLGKDGARKLRARFADLQAAHRVTDLVAGRPHPLVGDRAGQFAVDLDGGRRLVFRPEHDPIPTRDDGAIDWARVTAVRITFVGDYHD